MNIGYYWVRFRNRDEWTVAYLESVDEMAYAPWSLVGSDDCWRLSEFAEVRWIGKEPNESSMV